MRNDEKRGADTSSAAYVVSGSGVIELSTRMGEDGWWLSETSWPGKREERAEMIVSNPSRKGMSEKAPVTISQLCFLGSAARQCFPEFRRIPRHGPHSSFERVFAKEHTEEAVDNSGG